MTKTSVKLTDVERPNLHRETFAYTEFPKVVFDGRTVDYDIPDEIWITDTRSR